jgi:hypothetical protein
MAGAPGPLSLGREAAKTDTDLRWSLILSWNDHGGRGRGSGLQRKLIEPGADDLGDVGRGDRRTWRSPCYGQVDEDLNSL